jgi:antitoxin component of RelBE/YafQ-DinJ toxin-antitoxin module
MKTQAKNEPKTVARTVRFASAEQVSLIKRAAKKQGLPFNTLVTQASETAATQMLKAEPRDSKKVVADAIQQAHNEA